MNFDGFQLIGLLTLMMLFLNNSYSLVSIFLKKSNFLLKGVLVVDLTKFQTSQFVGIWLFIFFFSYGDFLYGFMHLNLFMFIIILASVFFLSSLITHYYEMSHTVYGWDSLKNVLMNIKILFFEIMTIMSRPLSLTLRMSINLLIGHIAGCLVYYNMGNISSLLFFMIESAIITLQVSVFVLLVCLYLDE